MSKRTIFIISDNLDAGSPERIALIRNYLNKIATANKTAPMFTDVAIYFHPIEIMKLSPIFTMARDLGIGIVADSMNATRYYAGTDARYEDCVQRLIDVGVTMARVDDANTKPREIVKSLLLPLDIQWFLSCGVHFTEAMNDLASEVLANVKATPQMYLNGANISFMSEWFKNYRSPAIDFECYNDGDRMTTPQEVLSMGRTLIATRKPIWFVYGHDENTNFLRSYGKQWQALQTVMKEFWLQK